jgi:hypothetical protein
MYTHLQKFKQEYTRSNGTSSPLEVSTPFLLRVGHSRPGPIHLAAGFLAGGSGDGLGCRPPLYSSSGRFSCRFGLGLSRVASGVMPIGVWSPALASGRRWLVVVLLLTMALQRVEPVVDFGGSSTAPTNKLGGGSDLRIWGCLYSWCAHGGHGGCQEEDFSAPLRSALLSYLAAAFLWRSLAVDSRRLEPSCLCLFRPKGGPPQPQDNGCSTSVLEALAGDSRRRHTSFRRQVVCPRRSQDGRRWSHSLGGQDYGLDCVFIFCSRVLYVIFQDRTVFFIFSGPVCNLYPPLLI